MHKNNFWAQNWATWAFYHRPNVGSLLTVGSKTNPTIQKTTRGTSESLPWRFLQALVTTIMIPVWSPQNHYKTSPSHPRLTLAHISALDALAVTNFFISLPSSDLRCQTPRSISLPNHLTSRGAMDTSEVGILVKSSRSFEEEGHDMAALVLAWRTTRDQFLWMFMEEDKENPFESYGQFRVLSQETAQHLVFPIFEMYVLHWQYNYHSF